MISQRQRMYYIEMASQAYRRALDPDLALRPQSSVLSLNDWRRVESQYATAGKSLSDGLTNDELTRCLCNFSSWVERGCRATIFEMNLAVGRSRVRMLQPVWDAINPRVRANVMRERFKIVFLEEAGTFDPKQLSHLRLTLERLAQQYPATKETTHAH